jgi:hypothetical protein
MKYWSINYPDENDNDVVETLSEDEIIKQYWPHWYNKMCEKFGKEHVNTHYCEQDCIDDWVICHWAWRSD